MKFKKLKAYLVVASLVIGGNLGGSYALNKRLYKGGIQFSAVTSKGLAAMEATPNCTVEKILTIKNLSSQDYYVMFKDQILCLSNTLKFYGIEEGSTVHILSKNPAKNLMSTEMRSYVERMECISSPGRRIDLVNYDFDQQRRWNDLRMDQKYARFSRKGLKIVRQMEQNEQNKQDKNQLRGCKNPIKMDIPEPKIGTDPLPILWE